MNLKPLNQWLDDYAADHTHPVNQKLHLICVPLIYFSVAGVLHYLPWHAGDVLIGLAVIWYAMLGRVALLLMAVQVCICLALAEGLRNLSPDHALYILLGIFAVGWIGQFYGHHLEGRRPSFFRDLQYLLIGPLWVWLGNHGS
jgi:uncharacterized membrane protein YGL010W